MRSTFCLCSSLIKLPDISLWNASNVKDMNGMFMGCLKLQSLPDISQWDEKMFLIWIICLLFVYRYYIFLILKNGK